MRSIIALLTLYGIASFLPVLLVPLTSRLSTPVGLPLRVGDWLDLGLTPWVGVGTFAVLYVLLPKASGKKVTRRNLFRV